MFVVWVLPDNWKCKGDFPIQFRWESGEVEMDNGGENLPKILRNAVSIAAIPRMIIRLTYTLPLLISRLLGNML